MKKKTPLSHEAICVLSDAWFQDLKIYVRGLEIKFVENYFFLENYVISKGAISHNVYTINSPPLPVTK